MKLDALRDDTLATWVRAVPGACPPASSYSADVEIHPAFLSPPALRHTCLRNDEGIPEDLHRADYITAIDSRRKSPPASCSSTRP